MRDSVTTVFECDFAFATGFPVTLCSLFSREMTCHSWEFIFVNSVHTSKQIFTFKTRQIFVYSRHKFFILFGFF